MKKTIILKQMLMVAIITFFMSTIPIIPSMAQRESNSRLLEKEYQSIPNETYIPYLEIVLENGTKIFTPTDDTYIANYDPSEVNGDLDYLATRNRYGAGDIWECDILIKFDLSSIPPSTPILAASLYLYYYQWGDSNPVGRPLTIYRITSNWDEMSVNYNTRPTTASNISASKTVPGSVGVWMSWELTNDVQQYINKPGINFGWEIMDETYWGAYWVPVAYFYPKEFVYIPPGPPFIPYLEIILENGTKIFTPTDDTYIANYDPSEVNGDLDYLATRNRYGAGDIWECDILIKFDLSSIPPFTPILAASLYLYYYQWGDSNPKGRPLTVYKITSNWDEKGVNYNRRPSKATEISASEKIPNTIGVGMKWNLTEDVQYYINNPSNNFGWEIMDETYWGGYYVPVAYFYPKEYATTNFVTAFIIGKITNKTVESNFITFKAIQTNLIYFLPITYYHFNSNEKFILQRGNIGLIGKNYIFSLCKISPVFPSTT